MRVCARGEKEEGDEGRERERMEKDRQRRESEKGRKRKGASLDIKTRVMQHFNQLVLYF